MHLQTGTKVISLVNANMYVGVRTNSGAELLNQYGRYFNFQRSKRALIKDARN